MKKFSAQTLSILLLKGIGGILLIVGGIAAYYGPLEFYFLPCAFFPVLGRFVVCRQGVHAIAGAIVVLVGLMYGFLRRYSWAWWGMFLYFSGLAISSLLTFSRYNAREIYYLLNAPSVEMAFLERLTIFHDMKFAGIIGVPLLMILLGLLYTKHYFKSFC